MGSSSTALTHTFYAIEEIPTGRLMPDPGGRSGTHVEFADNRPPRLFKRDRNAKACLTHWLRGKAMAQYNVEGEFAYMQILPQPDRKPEHYRVVRVKLEVA